MVGIPTRLCLILKRSKILFLLPVLFQLTTGFASSRFTEKYLEALSKRVGNTYWVIYAESQGPLFFSAPSPSASSFHAGPKESFEMTDMVEGPDQRLYYKVQFASGRDGYISVDSFMQELNSTLATQDPDRNQKKRRSEEAQEESKRVEQIGAQPWPENVKQAAIKRQPALGMTAGEVRIVLGAPKRVTSLTQSRLAVGRQERWIYEPGPVLIFTDGVLTQIQGPAPTKP